MVNVNLKPPSLTLSFANKARSAAEDPAARRFFPILQQGFFVRARVGCTIKDLLCEQFGVDSDYLKNRITTIFLNGKAIDDAGTSRVGDGATLALSAAMPGLVGATMRAGGYYAAMRGAMTHLESGDGGREEYGHIRIKLFNLLMAEMGPGFLAHGVIVPGEDLAEILSEQPSVIREGCRRALLNGEPVDPAKLTAGDLGDGENDSFRLTVTFEE